MAHVQERRVPGTSNRSLSQLRTAREHLIGRAVTGRPDFPGRLVAQCMFGFWVNLLDEGGYVGSGPSRRRVRYEPYWRQALSRAFPGGRSEARSLAGASFTRAWTHSVAKNVNILRNRVAHHEPLLNGFPLPGQSARMSAREGFEEYLRLTRMIDRDLADWITHNTRVPTLLSNRPS